MTELVLTIVFLTILFLFLGTGIWVAMSLLGVAAIGMFLFTERPVGDAMATTIWGAASSWTLTALPLFIWMGEILFRTKLSENLFKGLAPLMRQLPGGLLHVNIAGCTIFAAISGSSAATVATVGKMSIPELRARGYHDSHTPAFSKLHSLVRKQVVNGELLLDTDTGPLGLHWETLVEEPAKRDGAKEASKTR